MRQLYRFSLRRMLLAITAVSLLLAVVTTVVRWYQFADREHQGEVALSSLGGTYSKESAVMLQRMGRRPNALLTRLYNPTYGVDLSVDAWPRKEPGKTYPAISDQDLILLTSFSNLRELDLHGTSISDAAVPSLNRLTELEQLNLSDTMVTAEGVKRLRATLPACNIRW